MAIKTLHPLGSLTLVTGPEEFLNDRVVRAARGAVRVRDDQAELTDIEGARLDAGTLGDLTAPSLFAATRCLVVRGADEIDEGCFAAILDYAAHPDPDIALVLVHPGGMKGTGLLTKLRRLPMVAEHKSEAVRGRGLSGFLTEEVRRHRAQIDPDAVALVLEAVGADLRALSAAADQLSHDFPGEVLTREIVGRYFSGRAEVKGFEIAEHALRGRTARALEELRWALETGVGGPALTGAFASTVRSLARYVCAPRGMREADLAREVGVPPFRLGALREQSRFFDTQGLGIAIRAVAEADAQVKGAGAPPAWALERMVLTIAGARLRH